MPLWEDNYENLSSKEKNKFRKKEEMMQRIQLPVKNVTSILHRTFLGDKHFLQANEGKAITFIIVNNCRAIHRIRDSIPRNEFLAVFASYPLQQPPHHTNHCLFCVLQWKATER